MFGSTTQNKHIFKPPLQFIYTFKKNKERGGIFNMREVTTTHKVVIFFLSLFIDIMMFLICYDVTT